ncbi:MAG: hypothetical protein SGJ27_24515 [Candidatus Melainabacteria bacterium]|nr:hypothetical protein [Candidatus Melainabacteria bacterium]
MDDLVDQAGVTVSAVTVISNVKRSASMLPPEKIPNNLSHIEYTRLQIRYTSLGWLRQAMAAAAHAIKNQPQSENLSVEAKKRTTALFDALEKVLLLGEFSEGIEKNVKGLTEHTLNQADKALDKIQHVKQVKDGIKSVFTMVSQTVQETIDGGLENHLLPAFGMPLDRIPEGKTTEEYYRLALRYDQIGACEPARECLQKVLDVELKKDTQLANQAQRFLKTRIPARKVNHDAMIQYMSALRFIVTKKEDIAKDLLVELEVKHPNFEAPLVTLASMELKDGNLDRGKYLLNAAQQVNPNYIKTWCAKGRLAIAEWFLLDLDYCVDKASSLNGFDSGTTALAGMKQFIDQNGLR